MSFLVGLLLSASALAGTRHEVARRGLDRQATPTIALTPADRVMSAKYKAARALSRWQAAHPKASPDELATARAEIFADANKIYSEEMTRARRRLAAAVLRGAVIPKPGVRVAAPAKPVAAAKLKPKSASPRLARRDLARGRVPASRVAADDSDDVKAGAVEAVSFSATAPESAAAPDVRSAPRADASRGISATGTRTR